METSGSAFLRRSTRRCPLLWPLLAYILGILISEGLAHQLRQLPWGTVAVAVVLIGLLLWKFVCPQRGTLLYLSSAWMLLSVLLYYALLRREAPEEAFPPDTKHYRAHLIRTPMRKSQNMGYTLLLQADLCHLGKGKFVTTAARLRLNYHSLYCDLQVGDEIWIQGTPKRILSRSGEYDYAARQARKGMFFEDRASAKKVVSTSRTRGNWLWIQAQRLRQTLCKNLIERLSPKSAALTQGLLLGDRTSIDERLRGAFAATGTVHLLVVSGLHVNILYVLAVFAMGCVPLGRYGLLVRLLVAGVALWGFAFVVGLSAPVVRATALCSLFIVAQWLGRRTNSYNSLSAAALLILLLDPRALFSLSFQLSFLAVLGILLFYKPLYSCWPLRKQWLQIAWGSVCVSLAAQLAVFPLVVYHFQLLSLIFPLINLLLMPLLFVVLPLGLSVAWLPWIAPALAPLLELALQLMTWLIRQAAAWPGSHLYPLYFSEAQAWILYAVLLMGSCFLFLRRPVFVLASAALLLVHLAIDWQRSLGAYESEQLRLSVNRRNELLLQYLYQGVVHQSLASENDATSARFLQRKGLQHALGSHPTVQQTLLPVVDELLYATRVGGQRILWLKRHALDLGRQQGPPLGTDILLLSRQRIKDIPPLLARFSFRTAVLAYSSEEVVDQLRASCNCELHLLTEAGPYYRNLLSHSPKKPYATF